MKIWCKHSHPQAIQDIDEFVSSLEQIIATDQALLQAKQSKTILNNLFWYERTTLKQVLLWMYYFG